MLKKILLATVFATSTNIASANVDYIDKSPLLLDGCANVIIRQFNDLNIPIPKNSIDPFIHFVPQQFQGAVIGQFEDCISNDLRPSIPEIPGVLFYPKGTMV